MIQMISALLAGAFLLSGTSSAAQATQLMCVHSYDASADELSIFFDTAYDFVPKIQYMTEVSKQTADEVITELGMCTQYEA